jgi:hypothetical protein
MSTTTAPESSSTQRGRILGVLIAAKGDWVPLPRIAELAAQYNARIFECRRLGFKILNRTAERDGERRSWFRLISGPPQADTSAPDPRTDSADSRIRAAAPPNSTRREREETLPLFPEGNR